jgi:alkylation response protein AidB-like acyl-CoA dehydrogenase
MSAIGAAADPLLEPRAYANQLEGWLAQLPPSLLLVRQAIPSFAERVRVMSGLMQVLHIEGWNRYGWPEAVGGLGGTIVHRAAMWEALARHGVRGMGPFEHVEILMPTLVAMGLPGFTTTALPAFLAGRERWAQGFSEPDAGSDLASLRTRATAVGDGYAITGRKIWTSWAAYARWCLVLARTGSTESRHRGLTAFVVDLRSPGVTVRRIEQANGTDELAEVVLDEVFVPAGLVVGDPDGGWAVAMHILRAERSTFAWFRHCFLYRQLLQHLRPGDDGTDGPLGDALLDLAAVTATSLAGLRSQDAGGARGPEAAFTKLLLGAAERAVHDRILDADDDLAVETEDAAVAVLRQDYLFSRIVTVYGGSQQMQLETVAKQVLRLP